MVDSVRMLSLDDNRWNNLTGGYRMKCDPRPLLAQLESEQTREAAWHGLWEELHQSGRRGRGIRSRLLCFAVQDDLNTASRTPVVRIVQYLVGEVSAQNRTHFSLRSPLLKDEKHNDTNQQRDDHPSRTKGKFGVPKALHTRLDQSDRDIVPLLARK
jgi:hypothetical protein